MFLMARVESTLWKTQFPKQEIKNDSSDDENRVDSHEVPSRDILSVGIGVLDENIMKMSKQELIDKVWADFAKDVICRNGEKLSEIGYLHANIWDSFIFNSSNGNIDTHEPKFSNSTGTLKLMPKTKMHIKNLVHATSYVDVDCPNMVSLFNMETGAYAAKLAAGAILNVDMKKPSIWAKILDLEFIITIVFFLVAFLVILLSFSSMFYL